MRSGLGVAIATITLVGYSVALPAQNGAPSPEETESKAGTVEPDMVGVFYRLSAGTLVPLERQSTTKLRRKGMFTVTVLADLPGAKSPVRFRAGERIEFVVRIGALLSDPGSTLLLQPLKSTKKSREYVKVVADIGGMKDFETVPVEFNRYGETSLKITPHPLQPGEYGLAMSTSQAVYCFGVDPQ